MKEVSKIIAGKALEASIRSGLGYEGALHIIEDVLMGVIGTCIQTNTSPFYGTDFMAIANLMVEHAHEKYKNAAMDPAEAIRKDAVPN